MKRTKRWQFILSFTPDYAWIGKHRIIFGIFKIKNYPNEGEMISDYKGFLINKSFSIKGFEIKF